jgi:hypothetical protein
MAQGAVAAMAVNGDSLAAAELREILEYERIVQFKDAVLAGTHPRIKIPPHLAAKSTNSTRHLSSPTNSTPYSNHVAKLPPYNATQPQDQAPYFPSPINNRTASSANGQVTKSGKSEIDPIFLQKSDDLIKAEMMLQRQRLERSLRDQIEDQRQRAKALLQTSESLPSFDISEVLLKAQALVNPSPSAQTEPAMVTGDTPADNSDSFDENSFYSSQHDSSQWSNSSHGQKDPIENQSHGLASVDRRSGEPQSVHDGVGGAQQDMISLSTNNQLAANTQPTQSQYNSSNLPGLGMVTVGATMSNTLTSNIGNSAEVGAEKGNNFGEVGTSDRRQDDQATVQSTTNQLIRQVFNNGPASPVMRVHNLSPLAPQPARVSPLATARDPPILRGDMHANEVQPAQVTALRTQPGGMSSTDSSPKANKQPERERKRGKKKKRKANNSGDSPDSIYIKPEPKSPSPYAVAPLPRPQKRQRQVGQYSAELNYDDQPRYQPESVPTNRAPERPRFAEPRAPPPQERMDERYESEVRRPEPVQRRVGREDDSYRRISSDTFARRPVSPAQSTAYTDFARPTTRAVSYMDDERPIERPRYYFKEPVRTVVRPEGDRERSRSPIMREARSPAMAPPRQPVRIIVDEYGREYIDPTPAPVPLRQSVAPPVRYREEVIYERPPMRAASSRAAVEYEEDGVVYRRPASPLSAVPRRIITQPEFAMPPPADYRSYREREYSARPTTMAPPGEDYTPTRAPERRVVSQYDAPAREYATRTPIAREREPYSRAVSVHPEAVRYEVRGEVPREFARAPSVRPGAEVIRYEPREEVPREFARAPSVRPGAEVLRYEPREEIPREYIRGPTARPEPIRYETREEALRDYDTRAMSVRPDVRYEAPREYVSRLSSVRPEGPPREYVGSVRPEVRREIVPMPQREYSVRPMEAPVRREFMPPPGEERYYEDASRGRPVEVGYADVPRARDPSVVVYGDEPRREVYR